MLSMMTRLMHFYKEVLVFSFSAVLEVVSTEHTASVAISDSECTLEVLPGAR